MCAFPNYCILATKKKIKQTRSGDRIYHLFIMIDTCIYITSNKIILGLHNEKPTTYVFCFVSGTAPRQNMDFIYGITGKCAHHDPCRHSRVQLNSSMMLNKLEATEMWFLRRMQRISYTEHVTNVEVLRRANTKRKLLYK